MDKPVKAANSPYVVSVEAGKSYFWCACGRSKKQPFCDGAHAGTGITPFKYVAKESKMVDFCGCKQTKTPPLCDKSACATS